MKLYRAGLQKSNKSKTNKYKIYNYLKKQQKSAKCQIWKAGSKEMFAQLNELKY